MTIMGFLALVVALVMTILKLFVMKEKPIPQFVAVATAFAAGKVYHKISYLLIVHLYCKIDILKLHFIVIIKTVLRIVKKVHDI